MGWTSLRLDYDETPLSYLSGRYFSLDEKTEVVKAAKVGSTVYIAVRTFVEEGRSAGLVRDKDGYITYAAIFLTSTSSTDYHNFSYKPMDESCNPYQYDCPVSILKLLSPYSADTPDDDYGKQWRRKCDERRIEKNRIAAFKRSIKDGTRVVLKRDVEFAGGRCIPKGSVLVHKVFVNNPHVFEAECGFRFRLRKWAETVELAK